MKIGIPRALYYHSYSYIWKNFFDKLDIEYIVSPKTNKEILKKGKNIINDETCLPIKIYLGHIDYLKDKCDYILTPRYLGSDKLNLSCIKFNSLYDIVKNIFKDIKLLDYNIDYSSNTNLYNELVRIGNMLNYKNLNIKNIVKKVFSEYKEYKINEYINQNKLFNNDKKKILILSHTYNIEDEIIGKKIVNIIKNYNIDVILSSKYIYCDDNSNKISDTLYWDSSRQILNALDHYKNLVDGIILISSFPCGNDCLVNELIIRKLKKYKIINIVIDEVNSTTGLITRLESFIDIINGITI